MRLLWLKNYSVLPGSVTEWLVHRIISLSAIETATFVNGKLGEDISVYFAELVVLLLQSINRFDLYPSNIEKFTSNTMIFGGKKMPRASEWLDKLLCEWLHKHHLKGSSVYAATFLIYRVPTWSYHILIKRICMILNDPKTVLLPSQIIWRSLISFVRSV